MNHPEITPPSNFHHLRDTTFERHLEHKLLIKLTSEQADEICKAGKIPKAAREALLKRIVAAVEQYERIKCERSNSEVERNLRSVQKLVGSALKLTERKTWRPGEFRQKLADISERLQKLSDEAVKLLAHRNVHLVFDLTVAVDVPAHIVPVIDPIAFKDKDCQIAALLDLYGALAFNSGEGRPGRRVAYPERILHHAIALAYLQATNRRADDDVPPFIEMAEVIKRLLLLHRWHPESVARQARKQRAEDQGSSDD